MSRVTEIADEEARRAEAETPDDGEAAEEEETPPEEETPSEPEPAPEPEGLSDEERVKRLGQAVNRFERALQKLFGLEEPLQEVPMEGAIGFMLPGVLEMREHEDFRRCPTCNGHGRVLTGSVHEGDQTADCPNPNCRGRGYWRRETQPQPPPAPAVAQANGPPNEWEQPTWLGDTSIGAQQPAPLARFES